MKRPKKTKKIVTHFGKGINTLIEPRPQTIELRPGGVFTPIEGGGYIDMDMIKKVMDINPGMFKQEYTAEFKEKETTNPIDDWCQKWIKNEKSNNSI